MLNSSVLVLNRSYLPVHVTSARRAFTLLYQGIARVVNEQYQTFDFEEWSQLAVARDAEAVGTPGGPIRVPRVNRSTNVIVTAAAGRRCTTFVKLATF